MQVSSQWYSYLQNLIPICFPFKEDVGIHIYRICFPFKEDVGIHITEFISHLMKMLLE